MVKCKMKIKLQIALAPLILALTFMTFVFVSCDSSNDSAKAVHDPNFPIDLISFEPDSGRIREMVLLSGSNFGSDISDIKVFFNAAEAKVIGSTGTLILALTPRMPGDTCVVMVQVGRQTKAYEHKFRYKIEASVTTLAGNGNSQNRFNDGLDNSQLIPVYVGADNDYNLFVTVEVNTLLRINLRTNTLQVLATGNDGFNHRCMPIVNSRNNVLQMGAEGTGNSDRFMFLDPADGWAPKLRFIKSWDDNGCPRPAGGPSGVNSYETHYQCLYCEADEMYYTRYNGGQIVRINPETWEAKIIGMTPVGNTYGVAFHPINKSELWIAYTESSGNTVTPVEAGNSIFTLDVTDERKDENNILLSLQRRTGPITVGGHRDGPISESQFNGIRGISFDSEGNLYVGDIFNHCIRMINTQTMMVSTLIGIPGVNAPFLNGQRESATFNQPTGIAVDPDDVIYVADFGNRRVRRIAIE